MSIPTMMVTASTIAQLLGDGVDVGGEVDVEALAGMGFDFICNIKQGTLIPGDGDDIWMVQPVKAVVNASGVLCRVNEDGSAGAAGVPLLASDAVELTRPLQWRVRPGRVLVGARWVRPRPWWFNAQPDGFVATLRSLLPVDGVVTMPSVPDPGPAGDMVKSIYDPNDRAADVFDRANHVGQQQSSSISDFMEAAQDAVAALLTQGTGVALTYNDAANTLTVAATGSGGLDAEAVRDAIGIAMVGIGNISVVVNDAADTITISTTATQNATDAQLRDRATHTGEQAIATVTGLQTGLDGKQPRFMTGTIVTAGATVAKTVTLNSPWAAVTPATGDLLLLTFTNGNTATAPTLAVNGGTAKPLRTPGGGTDAFSTFLAANGQVLCVHDGTYYQLIASNAFYNEITQAEIINTSSTGVRLISGRRAEDLMVNEATKSRTLTGKTISGASNTITNLSSSAVTDFTEAVQDAVAAFLTQGTNVTLTYNDAGNTLTVAAGGGGGLDAEAVRDAIGIAMAGVGLISVTVNDAADTITISTTATANDTDANLKNRANHTGQQASSTISDFAASADARVNALAILRSLIDAKGDLIVGSANDTPARLPAGTDGHVLTLDSAQALGLKWAAAGGGSSLPSYSQVVGAVTADVPVTITHGLNTWDVDVEFQRSWLVAGALTATVRGEVIDPPKWRKVSKNAIEFDTSENWAVNEFIVRVRQFTAAGDTTAPTAGVLSSPAQGLTTIDLSIAGAADAVGVAGIDIYRAGVLITTLAAGVTTYQDTGRTPGTAYSYQAVIFDLYGNPFSTNTITPSTLAPADVAYVTKGTAQRSTTNGAQITVPITVPGGVANGWLLALIGVSNVSEGWAGWTDIDTKTLTSSLDGALTLLDGVNVAPTAGQATGSMLLFGKQNPTAGAHSLATNVDDGSVDNLLMGQAFLYSGVGSLGTIVKQEPNGAGNLAVAVPSVAVGDMAFGAGVAYAAQFTAFNQTIREAWGSAQTGGADFITAGDAVGAAGTINFTATNANIRGGLGVRLIRAT